MQNINEMILKALGMEKASEEKKKEVMDSLGSVIYQSIITRAFEEMNEESLDEFEKLTSGETTPDMVMKFFFDKIPNFESMMSEETAKVLADSMNMVSKNK